MIAVSSVSTAQSVSETLRDKTSARLGAGNAEAFVNRAADTNSRSVALFERRRAELLSARSEEVGGIVDFINVAGFALNRNRAGHVIALFPCDEIAWTEITANAMKAMTNDLPREGGIARRPVLATSGSVTPIATRELQKLGWQVQYLK